MPRRWRWGKAAVYAPQSRRCARFQNARLNAAAALSASGALPENVNYAVKSSYLLCFLEVFADGQLKLKKANGKEIKFEEVVERAKQAAVLVLVYSLLTARERKEHREISLRSLRSFAAKSAKQTAVLVLVY